VDPKLVYWTAALANLAVITACLLSGAARIRRGDLRGHRRRMLGAAALVALFLVSYALKLALLGREDRSQWAPLDLTLLYVHELCIGAMLVAGAAAGFWARRLQARLSGAAQLSPADAALAGRRAHRRAGRVAVVASLLAFVSAAAVLAGMYARAPR